jgi:hypothetical protein
MCVRLPRDRDRSKRDGYLNVIERPDLWRRAMTKDFGVEAGMGTLDLALDEYYRLLREEA